MFANWQKKFEVFNNLTKLAFFYTLTLEGELYGKRKPS